MALRATQIKGGNHGNAVRGFYTVQRSGGGATIRGMQAHSLDRAQKFGNEERKGITLPRLKFLEKPLDEET
jgi:hypothetical protein